MARRPSRPDVGAPEVPTAPLGYYRFPTLRRGRIVFTTEGNLWSVDRSGGLAHRLTRFPGRQAFAALSPDGSNIAYSASYQGNEDVWVMATVGGEPRRLTAHPAPDHVIGWSPDGSSVLFRSTRDSALRDPAAFSVGLDGSDPVPLQLGPVARLSYSPDGRRVALGRYALEFHRWKRYLGGWVQEIWVGQANGKDFKKVTTYPGMNAFPMWYGDRIYFLSDRDGTANIYSMNPDGGKLRQHTHQTQFSCRWPDLGDDHIVYTVGADLWLLDLKQNREIQLHVSTATDRSGRQSRLSAVGPYLTDFDTPNDGKRVLVGTRGQILLPPVKEGRTITLGASGVRLRAPRYAPDGKAVGAFTDEGGEESFVLQPLDSKQKPKLYPATKGFHHRRPLFSPDGKTVAIGDQTLSLRLLNLKTGKVVVVDTSPTKEITDYAWSADSRWLAYARPEENQLRGIYIHDTRDGATHRITNAFSDDYSPCFDREGKYLFFLSQRHLDPVVGEVDFEAIFEPTARVYAIGLHRGERSPLTPRQPEEDSPSEEKGEGSAKTPAGASPAEGAPAEGEQAKEKKDKKDKKDKKPSGPKPVTIDFDGIENRLEELPTLPTWCDGLEAAPGRLFYMSRPLRGLLARDFFWGDHDPGWTLKSFDLKRRREETWVNAIHGFRLTADGKKLIYRGRELIRVVGTETKPRGEEEEKDKDDGEKGIVRLRTHTIRVNPPAEWLQMLREAWRLERDFFYDPNLAGVDWDAVWVRYSALMDRIATREELTDLIGEMISELCTSHTYVFSGDTSDSRPIPVGLLGADLETSAEGGARVARILHGRDWSDRTRSPLAQPHVGIGAGSRIVAVEGQLVLSPEGLHAQLAGRAGQEVLFTIVPPGKKKPRDVVVRTMRPWEETELRYLDWIERNRRLVDERTEGQVGYLHIPDMGGKGLSEFSRAFYPQIRKKGMVIDIRYNGGGFVSQLIVARLARRLYAFMQPRHGLADTYPARVFHAPFVVVTNHAAGSDGDIFAESVQLMKLAPVIGTRSWGGVVGLNEVYRLVDNGIVTVPGVAWWDPARGWDLENAGVVPDIPVEQTPSDARAGIDAQLETAITVVLERVRSQAHRWPSAPPYPDKSLPTFQKRHRGPKDRA